MIVRFAVIAGLMGSTLTGCGTLRLGNGVDVDAQQDAISECAKAEGDHIFPIAIGFLLASGQNASVKIEANERLSQEGADRINACADARVAAAATSGDLQSTPLSGVNAPLASPISTPQSAVSLGSSINCAGSTSILTGGAGYCTAP